jgi:hypothetical protein
MTKILSVSVFMFVAVAVCSSQNVVRGNELLAACKNAVQGRDDPSVQLLWSGSYCLGLAEGLFYASPKVCTGEHVTLEQGIRVVFKYLQDHPEELDQIDAILVERALAKAFPCKTPS